ncbi:MAG TPA: ABC transporter ATP-binding protein, partial [Planctomycetaceae bacterium]|nr:ABC transporter ATP-binding protein [Planctomycetaceae bacterium]
NQQTILELLRDACHQNQIAMLLVTHSQEVAKQFERVESLAEFNKVHARV